MISNVRSSIFGIVVSFFLIVCLPSTLACTMCECNTEILSRCPPDSKTYCCKVFNKPFLKMETGIIAGMHNMVCLNKKKIPSYSLGPIVLECAVHY